jgi:hypothetical protein
LIGVRLILRKITLRLAFGSAQAIIAFASIILALLIKSNLFNVKFSMGVPEDGSNFYVFTLLVIGFVFLIAGFFLIYEWWESRL